MPRLSTAGENIGSSMAGAGISKRTLVLHYHIFKNAGTSVDEMLRRNFGARWGKQEFRVPRGKNRGAVEAFLAENPQLDAVSSHTALLPVPQLAGLSVFPIIFLRHPIDRLRSAYEFEKKQAADTAGARLAKAHDFEGYLRALLSNRHLRQARNFQTFRLSHNLPAGRGPERERAIMALSELPFVGLVEEYETSLARLQTLLFPLFPQFRATRDHANVTPLRASTLEERLSLVEKSLGREFFQDLCEANQDDLAVFDIVRKRYGTDRGNVDDASAIRRAGTALSRERS